MTRLDRRLIWLLPAGWMGLIWWMSADSSSGVKSLRIARLIWDWLLAPLTGLQPTYPVLFTTDTIFRKCCHVIEYAIMAGLFYVALATASRLTDRPAVRRWTVLLTILWACVDELHQSFVPGRAGYVRDVGIDSLGALLAVALISIVLRWRRPIPAHT